MDFDSENLPVETSEAVPESAPPVVETVAPEPGPQPVKRRKTASSPVVTINIQSWATPIVGIVMLLAGLLLGYYWRPLVDSAAQVPGKPAAASSGAGNSGANPTNAKIGGANLGAANPSSTDPAGSPSSTPTLMEFLISQTRHFKGDPNAPITIVEFSDYQWPYCGKFATDAGRQIDQEYVDKGKVRFGYWHFTFLGQESQWAAEASECAGDQDAFWQYHDLLFNSQSGENQGAFNKDNLKKFAADLKLDTKAFDECLDTGKYTNLVQYETTQAQSLGVRSTPAFVVNGQPLVGAQPYDTFKQVIEQQLAGKQ